MIEVDLINLVKEIRQQQKQLKSLRLQIILKQSKIHQLLEKLDSFL